MMALNPQDTDKQRIAFGSGHSTARVARIVEIANTPHIKYGSKTSQCGITPDSADRYEGRLPR